MGPSGCESGSGLPQAPQEFRLELFRRLELLEREIQALLRAVSSRSRLNSVSILRELEGELRERLAADDESKKWMDRRAEILVIWRKHRQEFEKLATEYRQRYEARRGRRNRGPRW